MLTSCLWRTWNWSNFLSTSKPGCLIEKKYYIGIALSSVVARLINKMILNRLLLKIDKHLQNNQNGFCLGSSSTIPILAIRRLIENVEAQIRNSIILYVDFKKASNSIVRSKMLKMLKVNNVPLNFLTAIALLYEDQGVN